MGQNRIGQSEAVPLKWSNRSDTTDAVKPKRSNRTGQIGAVKPKRSNRSGRRLRRAEPSPPPVRRPRGPPGAPDGGPGRVGPGAGAGGEDGDQLPRDPPILRNGQSAVVKSKWSIRSGQIEVVNPKWSNRSGTEGAELERSNRIGQTDAIRSKRSSEVVKPKYPKWSNRNGQTDAVNPKRVEPKRSFQGGRIEAVKLQRIERKLVKRAGRDRVILSVPRRFLSPFCPRQGTKGPDSARDGRAHAPAPAPMHPRICTRTLTPG